jgi:hypothetical protein
MAAARWRLMRIWSIERATMQTEIDKHDGGKYPPNARAAFAFRDLANQSRTLDLLTRYEVRFDRQFARALNLLLKLQQSCQTTPSGAGRPACASAEGASPSPVPPPPGPPRAANPAPRLSPQPSAQSQDFALSPQIPITPPPSSACIVNNSPHSPASNQDPLPPHAI